MTPPDSPEQNTHHDRPGDDSLPEQGDLESWANLIAHLATLAREERSDALTASPAPESLHAGLLEAAAAWAAADEGPWGFDSKVPSGFGDQEATRPVSTAALADLEDYACLELLGTGGQGQVYTARHLGTQELVAVKVRHWMDAGASDREREARENRFKAGAFLLQTLDHPNIAHAFDHRIVRSEHGDFCAIVQELVPRARTLTEAARQMSEPEDRLKVYLTLVEAIHYAHSRRVFHGDLKPRNVLVSSEGRVVVIDFDAAQFNGEPLLHSTGAGGRGFTAAYTSPEQFDGGRADSRSDIYSLGVILHELLTGRCPTLENGLAGLSESILRDDLPRLQGMVSPIERKMETIAYQCMRKRPEDRYSDTMALVSDVRAALAGEPIEARPPALRDRLSQWTQRHRTKLAAAAAVIALGAAGWLLKGQQSLAAEKVVLAGELDLLGSVTTALTYQSELEAIVATAPDATRRLKDLHRRVEELVESQEETSAARAEIARRGRPMASEARGRWFAMHEIADRIDEMDLFVEDRHARRSAGEKIDEGHLEAGLEHREALLKELQRDEPLTFDSDDDATRYYLMQLAVTAAESSQDTWSKAWDRKFMAAERVERHVKEDAALWDQVRAELVEDDRFAGLELQDQRGLHPLGKDPTSGLQEFGHLASGDSVADRNGGQPVVPTESAGLTLVLVPGATITLGAQGTDPAMPRYVEGSATIEAEYRVRLEPFFVSKYELTQSQATWMLGDNPSYFTEGLQSDPAARPGLYPAERISYTQAKRPFISFGLRFPTAAQAEYAMRAGTTTEWSFGSEASVAAEYMNLNDISTANTAASQWPGHAPRFDDGYEFTAPVGSFKPNPWGLFDVHGNVSEFTRSTIFGEGLKTFRDGDGWISIPGETKLIQVGGSYLFGPEATRSSYKVQVDETEKHQSLGVRLVCPVMTTSRTR